MSYKLTWDADPETEQFKVYRSESPFNGALPAAFATLPSGAREFTDTSPVPFSRMYYRIGAVRLRYGYEEYISRLVQIGYNGGASLDLDFSGQGYSVMDNRGDMLSKLFSEIITFTRASGAGRFNDQGVYEWLPANQPRINYDPVTGQCRGLLIEEQRTNLLTYSSDFANAAWSKERATIEPAAVISPDGTASASLLRESTAAGLHNTGRGGLPVEQGKQYTASVFAKSFSGNRVLRFALFGSVANIDLDTLEHNAFGSSALTVAATKAANGFTRVAITVTAGADSSMYLSLAQNISTASNNYTGDGTSGIYIWGAQLEAGSTPSSHIPTTTAQVTRAADVASVNTLSPWYNPEQGTLFVEAVAYGTTGRIVAFSDGTASNRLEQYFNSGKVTSFMVTNGDFTLTGACDVVTTAKSAKVATAFSSAGLASSVNGGAVLTDGTVPTIPALTRAYIGANSVGGGQLNGHIRSLRFYPRKFSDSELQEMTA